MAVTINKKHGVGVTMVDGPQTKKDETEQVGGPLTSESPMANIGLSVAMTKNLGNYENIKISVSCHIPCHPTAEDMEAAWGACEAFCDAKMNAALKEAGFGDTE